MIKFFRALVVGLALALSAIGDDLDLCITVGPAPLPPDPPPITGPPVTGTALTLPIEVLGPEASTRTFTLNLASGAATVTGLKLRVHSLTYEGKASVRVNGGAWRTLTDSNVVYPFKEQYLYGMGGIQSTLNLTVPLSPGEVVDGNNTLDFRFNDLDGLTIGYRVLALNFVNAGGTELIPSGSFVQEDPQTWVPPINTPEAIAEGQAIWSTATITERGATLLVQCKDCHAYDGRDLKYFNYSNTSIIERSKFHGLTQLQSEKVASYIRSLSVPYEPKGRPWNPPYQPGPGLDASPLRSWAAGAGLEAEAPTELDTLADMFPSGYTADIIGQTLNARHVRLAFQLPDWNRWLPKIHPNDAYPDRYPAETFVQMYSTVRAGLIGKSPLAAATFFNSKKSPWDAGNDSRDRKPNTVDTDPAYEYWAFRHIGIRHWRVVKTWEVMTEPEWQMEDKGQEIFGAFSADRRWFHGEVFNLGPHKIAKPKYDAWFQESAQWYQLQLVLNDGNRRNPSIVPIDWGYQHALLISGWNNPLSEPLYGAMVLNVYKGLEVTANELSTSDKDGWDLYKSTIHNLAPGNTNRGKYAKVAEVTRRAVANALLAEWLEQCERFTRAQYAARKNFKFDLSLYNYLTLMSDNFDEIGVDPALLARIIAFRNLLFPSGPP